METGAGIGRSEPFSSVSASDLDSVKFCPLRLTSGVAHCVLSLDDDIGYMTIHSTEIVGMYAAEEEK